MAVKMITKSKSKIIFLFQSMIVSIWETHYFQKSILWRVSKVRILLDLLMFYKAQIITTLYSNSVMAIYLKHLKKGRQYHKTKQSWCWDKLLMVFWLLLGKGSCIGNNVGYLRDLKPANIMHKGDLLKICDFGLSKQI